MFVFNSKSVGVNGNTLLWHGSVTSQFPEDSPDPLVGFHSCCDCNVFKATLLLCMLQRFSCGIVAHSWHVRGQHVYQISSEWHCSGGGRRHCTTLRMYAIRPTSILR